MKRKGFTLIEIMLVLVITGIIFSITMNFSRDQIGGVQTKQEKIFFIDTYNKIYQKNLQTKWNSGYIYSKMEIYIDSGSNTLNNIFYVNSGSDNIANIYKIRNGQFGLYSGHSRLNIVFNSLSPFCQLSYFDNNIQKTSKKYFFYIQFNKNKYCFSLKTPLCQLQEINCEGL